ncbi:lysine-specific demethylase [Dyella japonica]|uniref:JmjC domain-containing protein n=1 Tax=Dyella japonica TaxID=231455 RepID=A0ABV2JQ07_9GAMM
MSADADRLIEVDWGTFDPWRIQAVRHRLMDHPLLQLPSLVELSKRLESRGRVRTHSSDATPGTPFNTAPKLHPNHMTAASTLQQIEQAKAWMSLLNVQTDDTYRTLVDDVLDDVKPGVDRVDPGMCYRGGWIFITSPNTVTPFHFDKEHNFILQVSGRKTIYVWDHRDTVAASEEARDRFHACHERDRLHWDESLRARATVFHLEPGQGAYMPSTSPHMVENGDNASVTISFTYYTHATRRDSLLHAAHERMRGWGMHPPAVGQNALLDFLLHAGFRTAIDSREWLRRSLGKQPYTDGAAYAIAG